MPMIGTGLAAARKSAIDAIPLPSNDAASALAYATAVRVADSTAIVTYIQQNMGVTSQGADPQGGVVVSQSTVVT